MLESAGRDAVALALGSRSFGGGPASSTGRVAVSSRAGGGLKTAFGCCCGACPSSTDVRCSDGERVLGALGPGPSRPPGGVGRFVGVVWGAFVRRSCNRRRRWWRCGAGCG